jgi:hypothetical protein
MCGMACAEWDVRNGMYGMECGMTAEWLGLKMSQNLSSHAILPFAFIDKHCPTFVVYMSIRHLVFSVHIQFLSDRYGIFNVLITCPSS